MARRVPKLIERSLASGRSRLGAALRLLLASALGLGVAAEATGAGAAVVDNVIVIQDDGEVLEPAEPLPLAGRRLVLTPAGAGYTSTIEDGVVPAALGARLTLPPGDDAPAAVSLVRPVPIYGVLHRQIFVHPHGAVSFGAPLRDGAAAHATDPADLLSGLLSGPPVVAVLWNEIVPREASAPGAGVYVAELPDRVVVTWAKLPSVRPAKQANTFRVVLHHGGRIEMEYPRVAAPWGLVGLSPGDARLGTDVVDFATEPDVSAGRAAIAWYHDLPRLNEIALARRVFAEAPDRFDFLAVFTDRPVDGPHLVSSVTVANRERGIGMPIFDHARVFGSRKLEHIVLMNSLSLYDDDPARPPRLDGYAYAPSTLAVLSHELGHRWLAHAGEPLVAPGHEGHWNFFLDTDGSFMGGSQLVDNADGTFTTEAVMSRFGPLDQYLMGVRAPEDVEDFFVVDRPFGVDLASGDAPAAGITFGGERRDLSVGDVIAQLGERSPVADGTRMFRMGFVLVVGKNDPVRADDIAKLQRIRRSFAPYFRAATDGRARVHTWLPRGAPVTVFPDAAVLPQSPFILGVGFRAGEDGTPVATVDYLDVGGDLLELELSTDASSDLPPARIDLAPATFGNRRGTVSFPIHHVPAGATELHLSLVDSSGLRSETFAAVLPEASSET